MNLLNKGMATLSDTKRTMLSNSRDILLYMTRPSSTDDMDVSNAINKSGSRASSPLVHSIPS